MEKQSITLPTVNTDGYIVVSNHYRQLLFPAEYYHAVVALFSNCKVLDEPYDGPPSISDEVITFKLISKTYIKEKEIEYSLSKGKGGI